MKNTRNQCHVYVNIGAVGFYLLSLSLSHTHTHTHTHSHTSQIQTPVTQLDYTRAAVPLGRLLFICCQIWWYILWKPIRNHLRLLQKHFYTRQTIPFFLHRWWYQVFGLWPLKTKAMACNHRLISTYCKHSDQRVFFLCLISREDLNSWFIIRWGRV